MAALIDASVLIDVERGRLTLAGLTSKNPDEEVALAAVTVSELLHGMHDVKGAQAARVEAFVEGLLDLLPILPFDLAEARTHARLSAELASKGVSVGAHDLLIAATAIANDMRVITHDARSYSRIKGLEVVHLHS
jgi:predicted nucleic acid-binding protein